MVLSSVATLAAVDESYKEILEIVKVRIPDTDEFDDFSASQNESNGVKSYTFAWRNSETRENMEVQCLENGIITRYNCSGEELYQEKAMSDLSKEDALKKAKNAFYKLNPDLENKTVIKNGNTNKQLWETRQQFTITRIENGIEVYGDNGHIEMDMNADSILWYYMNWSDFSSFPNPGDAISVEEAQKLYAEKLGIHLIYKAKTEDGVIKPYLVYTPKNNAHKYIDMNGELISCNPYPVYAGNGYLTNDKVMMEGAADQFSKAEIAEMEKIDGLLSKEEVMKIAENEKLFNLQNFELQNVFLSRERYDKERYTYSLSYYSEEEKVRANVTLDAKTGEILSFSKPNYNQSEETVSEDVAQQTLKDAVKSLCKTHLDEFKFIESEDLKSVEYSVIYNRVVNGLEFPHDSIRANVDKYTGELTYYSKTYSKAEFPSKDNVISLNMIYKCAFDLFSYGLKYVPTYEENQKKAEVKLVYAFNSESFDIDPFTGEKYKYNNNDETLAYNDIENHYAKKYIEEMASYGVGIGNGNFMPDNEIRQKELVSLLVRVYFKYYETYPISEKEIDQDYDIAVREGIIPENKIDKEAIMTREAAAELFVNAMGYGEVAKAENIFKCPFGDVNENIGSISILYGLGIVSGDENKNFNPSDALTRADSMIMLYRCLSR